MRYLGGTSFLVVGIILVGSFQDECRAAEKPAGYAYVWDSFDSMTTTSQVWTMAGASCSQVLHKSSTNSFPTFGQTSRPGYCGLRDDAATGEKFIRFITLPFDRRDAGKFSYRNSVDAGKGGAETYTNASYSYGVATSSKVADKGWDLTGQYYMNSANRVRMSFKFRIYNDSIFQTGLAKSASLFQMHAQKGAACGEYYEGTSPNPGLMVRKDPLNSSRIEFYMIVKIFTDYRVAAGLGSVPPLGCSIEKSASGLYSKEVCEYIVWQESFARDDVLKNWISVSLTSRSTNTANSRFSLSFGREDLSASAPLGSKGRIFKNGSTTLNQPTSSNACPNRPYLGNYVLGYPEVDSTSSISRDPLYGFYKKSWLGLPDSASTNDMILACTTRPKINGQYYKDSLGTNLPWEPLKHRFCKAENGGNADTWVSDRIRLLYGKFIQGGSAIPAGESPPQLIVDYDNFRVVQED